MESRRLIVVAVAAVLLLRLPFLNQAIQGDDVYYLAGAQHAQIDPLHPNHARYPFLGDLVDMRGHPHPPLNVWVLAGLLALLGDIREVPFHAAYVVFSLVAALAMVALARRFSPHPLWATLLFLATPAFVINGNSFEADVPFLAFWMAGVALVVYERRSLAAVALALAALAAYQAVFLTPILAVWVWIHHRRSLAMWALVLVPPATLAAWQLFELATSGALPAAVLSGHFGRYGFQALVNKLRNAGALGVHFCWLVFPALVPPAVLALRRRFDRDAVFLVAWIGLFFAGALVVFFAGSARYLLPIAAPMALLVSRLPVRWLAAGFALHMPLSLALAVVNYQHWDGYRQFAASLRRETETRRVWINGEWGLRFYFEAAGGLPLLRNHPVRPGDIVVSSELGYPWRYTVAGGGATPLATREIRPLLPLRLIAVDTRSAYSTVVNGYLPFDVAIGPVDRVRSDLIVERRPTLSYLPMNAPEAPHQIASGIYDLENNRYRWMGDRAILVLRSPATPKPLRVVFYIPDAAPARRVSVEVDGREVVARSYAAPGSYTLESPAHKPEGPTASVMIRVDRTFSVPGDRRELGVVLVGVGYPGT